MLRSSRRAPAALVLLLVLGATFTACTSAGPKIITSTSTSTVTTTVSPTGNTGPLSTAKVSEKTVRSCPYISHDTASGDAGYRLDRITELIQSGKMVGCRFYPLEHPTAQCDELCLKGERLPPGNVPGIDLRVTQYGSALYAHNAFVKIAEAGTNYEQVKVATGNTGLCYETTVWDRDNGQDWACTFSKGAKVVVIKTVVVRSPLNVQILAEDIYPKV